MSPCSNLERRADGLEPRHSVVTPNKMDIAISYFTGIRPLDGLPAR